MRGARGAAPLSGEVMGGGLRTTAVTLHAREREAGPDSRELALRSADWAREGPEEGPASVGEKVVEAASRDGGPQRRRTIVAVDAGPIVLPPTYNPDWSRPT